MKKNILLIVALSLSVVSVASASTEEFGMRLGEEKLSETSFGSYKCEFKSGNVDKEVKSFGVAGIPARLSSGPSKAGSAR